MSEKIGPKEAKLRELKEARASRSEVQVQSRAKATKGKVRSAGYAKASRKIPVTPPEGVASRLGTGRTVQDRGGKKTPAAIAIRGLGNRSGEGMTATPDRATTTKQRAKQGAV